MKGSEGGGTEIHIAGAGFAYVTQVRCSSSCENGGGFSQKFFRLRPVSAGESPLKGSLGSWNPPKIALIHLPRWIHQGVS